MFSWLRAISASTSITNSSRSLLFSTSMILACKQTENMPAKNSACVRVCVRGWGKGREADHTRYE